MKIKKIIIIVLAAIAASITLAIIIIAILVSLALGELDNFITYNNTNESNTTEIETETPYTLNARQKKILRSEGIKGDYEDLTFDKQVAICSIETMLEQLEEKYNSEFIYVDYSMAGFGCDEELKAKDANNLEIGVITETRTSEDGEWVYEDDYAAKNAEGSYEEEVGKFLEQYVGEEDYRVDAIIHKLEDGDDVIAYACATIRIAVTEIDENKFDDMVQSYADWIYGKKESNDTDVYSLTCFILQSEEQFDNNDGTDIGELYHNYIYIKSKKIDISGSGYMDIWSEDELDESN